MPTSTLRPAPIALALALVALCGCASRGGGGGRAEQDPKAQRYAKVQQSAQSLMDRRAILDRDVERTSADLLAWAKRNKIRVPTQQLLLSLLSHDYRRYQPSSERPTEGFERDYAAIETAMARIANERAALARDFAKLRHELEEFEPDPDPWIEKHVVQFGDVFQPLAGIDSTERVSSCAELVFGEHRTTCALDAEHGKAVDPRRAASGWWHACIYTCYAPRSMR